MNKAINNSSTFTPKPKTIIIKTNIIEEVYKVHIKALCNASCFLHLRTVTIEITSFFPLF